MTITLQELKSHLWESANILRANAPRLDGIIARMNMILHGYGNARIEHGDTFDTPKHVEGGQFKKFDIVLANLEALEDKRAGIKDTL